MGPYNSIRSWVYILTLILYRIAQSKDFPSKCYSGSVCGYMCIWLQFLSYLNSKEKRSNKKLSTKTMFTYTLSVVYMSVQVTSKSVAIDRVICLNVQVVHSCKQCDLSLASYNMFNFCDQVASCFKSQWGSRSLKHAVIESLSIIVICYHNNYSSDCVFPYSPIEWVDASCHLPATYLATDSLWLGRSCKWASRFQINCRFIKKY